MEIYGWTNGQSELLSIRFLDHKKESEKKIKNKKITNLHKNEYNQFLCMYIVNTFMPYVAWHTDHFLE